MNKTSYGERLLRGYIKKCFPETRILYNYRKAGIINPDTGSQLELDIFIPKFSLAFEFNGRQHMTDEEQRKRDKIKRSKCKSKGIHLITIWTATLEKGLYEKIKKVCDKYKIPIQKPSKKYIREFEELASQYKYNIYKMNQKLKGKKQFIKRKRRITLW